MVGKNPTMLRFLGVVGGAWSGHGRNTRSTLTKIEAMFQCAKASFCHSYPIMNIVTLETKQREDLLVAPKAHM
jgi:hypothetical protein